MFTIVCFTEKLVDNSITHYLQRLDLMVPIPLNDARRDHEQSRER